MLTRLRRQGGFAASGGVWVVLAGVVSLLTIGLRAQTPLVRLLATGFGVVGAIVGSAAWRVLIGDRPGSLGGVWLLIAILGGGFLAARFSLSALRAVRGEALELSVTTRDNR